MKRQCTKEDIEAAKKAFADGWSAEVVRSRLRVSQLTLQRWRQENKELDDVFIKNKQRSSTYYGDILTNTETYRKYPEPKSFELNENLFKQRKKNEK